MARTPSYAEGAPSSVFEGGSWTGGAEMSRGILAVGFLEGGAAPFGFKGAGFDFRTGGAEMRRGIRAVGFLEGGAAPFGFKGAGFDFRLLLESNPSEFSPLLFPHSASNCSKANPSNAAPAFFAPG